MSEIGGTEFGGFEMKRRRKSGFSVYSLLMKNNMLFIVIFMILAVIGVNGEKKAAKSPVVCLQCGGDKYEGNVRLTRDTCCTATPVICQQDQVCLRAFVYSPYGNFFLSGCHPKEENLSGCDYHTLPHNSTVHRCVCSDEECQNAFPGDCPIKGITDDIKPRILSNSLTTSSPHSSKKVTVSSSPPPLIARVNKTRGHSSNSPRNRHHHNHSTNSSIFDFSFTNLMLVFMISCSLFNSIL